jgi:carboxyl-terminal processing protease
VIRRRVVIAILLVVLFALGWWTGRVASRDLYADLDLFVEVLHKVEANYVDPVEPRSLMDGAIKGMLRQLDPHSQYLDEKAYANLRSMTEGTYGGIGVELNERDGYPTVIAPIEGTPAWEAGLRSGDVIVQIDGRSTYGLTIEDAADRLHGPDGSQVRVKVSREGEAEDHEVALVRRIIESKAVPYAFVA